MAKVLKLTYTCGDGSSWTQTVPYPKTGLTLAAANTCMDAVIAQGIFLAGPAAKKAAEIVETTKTPLA